MRGEKTGEFNKKVLDGNIGWDERDLGLSLALFPHRSWTSVISFFSFVTSTSTRSSFVGPIHPAC